MRSRSPLLPNSPGSLADSGIAEKIILKSDGDFLPSKKGVRFDIVSASEIGEKTGSLDILVDGGPREMTERVFVRPLLLTKQEVWELTGYQRGSCQIRILRANGIRFTEAADGSPRVARAEIETPGRLTSATQPDFSSLIRKKE